MMKKLAENIARLLSRGDRAGRGFTDRQLKFIKRRGLKGLSTKQVKALIDKGMLPDSDKVLKGFNDGTENMFQWTPKKFSNKLSEGDVEMLQSPYSKINRDNNGIFGVDINPLYKEITIPDTTDMSGPLLDWIGRANVARHDAREWVRTHA
jgi:hypothetical protein